MGLVEVEDMVDFSGVEEGVLSPELSVLSFLLPSPRAMASAVGPSPWDKVPRASPCPPDWRLEG